MALNQVARTPLRELDSKSELWEVVRSSGGPSIVIGANRESPRMYFLLELSNKAGQPVKIGMILDYHGIKPSWILSPAENTVAIGHDDTISFVDLPRHRLVSSQGLDWVFSEFVPENSGDHFLVLHELGVDRFDYSGTRLWSVSTPDIAESIYFADERTLVIRHQGPDKELLVDMQTGVSYPRR